MCPTLHIPYSLTHCKLHAQLERAALCLCSALFSFTVVLPPVLLTLLTCSILSHYSHFSPSVDDAALSWQCCRVCVYVHVGVCACVPACVSVCWLSHESFNGVARLCVSSVALVVIASASLPLPQSSPSSPPPLRRGAASFHFCSSLGSCPFAVYRLVSASVSRSFSCSCVSPVFSFVFLLCFVLFFSFYYFCCCCSSSRMFF